MSKYCAGARRACRWRRTGHRTRLTQGQITLIRGGKERTCVLRALATEQIGELAQHGYVITLDDITDLVAAQRTSAWADMARRIAHEIKNPLTPIQLSAEGAAAPEVRQGRSPMTRRSSSSVRARSCARLRISGAWSMNSRGSRACRRRVIEQEDVADTVRRRCS